MRYVIGLGNPGDEYEKTRHNLGRRIVDGLHKKCIFSEWKEDKKKKCVVATGEIDGREVTFLKPQNYMNRSGDVVAQFIKNKKTASEAIVVYDDMDLAFGSLKIAYDRSSGGHKGLESLIKALKTREFIRLRVGIAPKTSSGKVKKPKGEENVIKFILSRFSKKEEVELQNIIKTACEALKIIVVKGEERAMNEFNT